MRRFRIIFIILTAISFFAFPLPANAAESEPKPTVYSEFTYKTLTIISHSPNYNKSALEEICHELLRNVTGPEFPLLSKIILLPEIGNGVLATYRENFSVNEKGIYTPRSGSYILIYGCDRYLDTDGQLITQKIAPVLSHEYGHHYTLSNITLYEGKYYSDWADSEYGELRSLSDYPIFYGNNGEKTYSRAYDIAEIAANDYVQLLGSENARLSYNYLDAAEQVKTPGILLTSPVCFNMRPQENLEIPLAADVPSLYSYFFKIAGFANETLSIVKHPEIIAITKTDRQYEITWSAASGSDAPEYEYTVVMYPVDNPSMIRAVKTVAAGEELRAVFGHAFHVTDSGSVTVISDTFSGRYSFRVFVRTNKGITFSSPVLTYSFDTEFDIPHKQFHLIPGGLTAKFIPPFSPLDAGGTTYVKHFKTVNFTLENMANHVILYWP